METKSNLLPEAPASVGLNRWLKGLFVFEGKCLYWREESLLFFFTYQLIATFERRNSLPVQMEDLNEVKTITPQSRDSGGGEETLMFDSCNNLPSVLMAQGSGAELRQ